MRWPRCSPTSPKRPVGTTRTPTRRSGARSQIFHQKSFLKPDWLWDSSGPNHKGTELGKQFRFTLSPPVNIFTESFQGLVYLREAGCKEGGAGCKYDSSCSAETWQVHPTSSFSSKLKIALISVQFQTLVFIFFPGSYVALWRWPEVLRPRGKTTFVQLQLRTVLRRNDGKRRHVAAES